MFVMARRRIGQEALRFEARSGRRSSLDELAARIDWQSIEHALGYIHAAVKGELVWPRRIATDHADG